MATLADLNTFLTACGQPNITAGQATRVSDWIEEATGLEEGTATIDDLGAWFYTTVRQQVISREKRITPITF